VEIQTLSTGPSSEEMWQRKERRGKTTSKGVFLEDRKREPPGGSSDSGVAKKTRKKCPNPKYYPERPTQEMYSDEEDSRTVES